MEVGSPRRDDRSSWTTLSRIGGIAALATAVVIPIQVVILVLWPPPSSVQDWFSLFHSDPLRGLLDMDLLLIVDMVLLVPILLALYVWLRRSSPSWMTLGTALGFVSIAAYFASNPAFQMLSLSHQYAAATTDAQRAADLAAGQTFLASYSSGTAFYAYYVLGSLALIAISAVMLRSQLFTRTAAWSGIAANVAALGLFVPVVGLVLSVASVFGLEIWYIWVGRTLVRSPAAGTGAPEPTSKPESRGAG